MDVKEAIDVGSFHLEESRCVMENKIMLANIFEELKIEEAENDRLTKEIEELKIAAKTAEAEHDNLLKEMIVLRYDRQELREAVEYWRTRAELFVTQARVLGQQIEQIKTALGGA